MKIANQPMQPALGAPRRLSGEVTDPQAATGQARRDRATMSAEASALARAAAAGVAGDAERVAALGEAVRDGTYVIEISAIARAIVEEELK